MLWFWLSKTDRQVDWLTVEAPSGAVAGEPFRLRVRIANLSSASMLCADLHWATERNSSHGFLSAGSAKPVGPEGGIFDFEILVQPQANLKFVNAILYLSPDGNWNHHSFAAATTLIPVTNVRNVNGLVSVRLPVHQLEEGSTTINRTSSPWLRRMTGCVWLACAIMLWSQGRKKFSGDSTTRPPQRWRLVLIAAFGLISIWELAGLEYSVGNAMRTYARVEDVYYPRTVFQHAAISIIAAALIVFVIFTWRHRVARLLPLSFGSYLAIAFVSLLSLHSIDRFASASWLGFTLVDALKFLCATTALASLFRKSNGPLEATPSN